MDLIWVHVSGTCFFPVKMCLKSSGGAERILKLTHGEGATLPDDLTRRDFGVICPCNEGNHLGVSINNGTRKSSILIGFSIINHPF